MKKTDKGLVEYAKRALGLPYWNGTFGQIATEQLYLQKRAQLPEQYTATDFPTQYGKRVHDCAGLIKGYFWKDSFDSDYRYQSNGLPDVNEYGLYSLCTERGKINTLREVPGLLVFKRADGKIYHVGVYIGGGEVIEAKGHAYGVVSSPVGEWDEWGRLSVLEYTGGEEKADGFSAEVLEWQKCAVADGFGFLNYGCDGEWGEECEFVARRALIQQWSDGKYRYPRLTALAQGKMGMPSDKCDGKCGPETTACIRSYQRSVGLSPDGGIGLLTWKRLLNRE